MRLKRTSSIILVFIITWATLIYFIFTNRPLNNNEVNENVEKSLSELEMGIKEQFVQNEDMINRVHVFLEGKKSNKIESNAPGNLKGDGRGVVIPVLVFACNRVTVSKCLDELVKYRPNPDQFPIIVSQVCKCIYFTLEPHVNKCAVPAYVRSLQ